MLPHHNTCHSLPQRAVDLRDDGPEVAIGSSLREGEAGRGVGVRRQCRRAERTGRSVRQYLSQARLPVCDFANKKSDMELQGDVRRVPHCDDGSGQRGLVRGRVAQHVLEHVSVLSAKCRVYLTADSRHDFAIVARVGGGGGVDVGHYDRHMGLSSLNAFQPHAQRHILLLIAMDRKQQRSNQEKGGRKVLGRHAVHLFNAHRPLRHALRFFLPPPLIREALRRLHPSAARPLLYNRRVVQKLQILYTMFFQ